MVFLLDATVDSFALLAVFRASTSGGVHSRKNIRVREVADEYRRALGQRQDGVGLYLSVWRQHALCQARDDRFGQCQVLSSEVVLVFRARLSACS